MNEEITGYVLAGGKSLRMGTDKRLLRVEGNTLLERAARLLEIVLGSPPVLVGDNLTGVAPAGYTILTDAQPDCGPLGGMVAVLDHCSTLWALVIAVDLPHLSTDDLIRLIQAPSGGLDGLSLTNGSGIEPLAALYAASTRSFWRERLEAEELSLMEGISRLRWGEVELLKASRGLVNINQIADTGKL